MQKYWKTATAPLIVCAIFFGMATRYDAPPPEAASARAPEAAVAASLTASHPLPALGDPGDCLMCHDDDALTMDRDGREVSLYVDPERYAATVHAGLDCIDCHAGYDPDELPHLEGAGRVDCAACHAPAARDLARGPHRGELTCSSCHGSVGAHRPGRASERTCATCHEDVGTDLEGSIHAEAEAGPACFDCHTPHQARAGNSALCLDCHGDAAFAQTHLPDQEPGLLEAFEHSIHAENVECADCHGGHRILAVDAPNAPVNRLQVAQTCATCHPDVTETYLASEHGRALAEGFASAPTCTDCHGEHDIHAITDGASPVSRSSEVAICLGCHQDTEEVRDRMTHSSAFISSYSESAHGLAAAAGNTEAAVCSDCHGAHDAMKASAPTSPTHPFNIAGTCGTCHDEIETTFEASIHGQALAEGVADAPTCTTCHGEHNIIDHEKADSPVAVANVSEQVCSPCHNSYKLSEKYDFPSDRTSSFSDSYHGLATRFGSNEAANCASCHGVHDILPSTNEASKVHPANLAETCGTCHPGANARFAVGKVHIVRTPEGDKLLYWISTIYLILIVVLVGGMFLHNVVDWFRKLLERQHERLTPAPARRKTRLYLRMTVNERIQHALLASSFILLVITGFTLKFPDAWWVRGLRDLGGEFFFDLRGILHRVAAVVMIAASFYHLYYVIATKRGRQFVRDILFRRRDLTEMRQMLHYNLGWSKERPQFGRFNYIEKSEYWALIWGTIIMSATGLVLWFENFFMGSFSKLFIDVNETVHYFEAWLAFLAIVVWHFYYVIFNPDVYPLNLTWLTGKITEEEMEHEHPRELEEIRERETAEV